MTGFGDPLFNPSQEGSGDKRGADKAGTVKPARGRGESAYADFWQGAGASIARDWRRRCRNCPTPPTETQRGRKRSRRFSVDIHLG